MQRAVMERLLSFTPLEAPRCKPGSTRLSRYFSPYDVNPLNINPLKDLFEEVRRLRGVARQCRSANFHLATNVQTAACAFFPRDKITADAGDGLGLPATDLFRAVEIDGVPYWDGRLSRQSGDLSVVSAHHDRGRAGGADQSAGAAGDADVRPARS